MIKEFHKSKNLFDLVSWIIANGSTYTKDGESYTFDTKQSMFSTPFYFSNTDIVVSISGIIESITAPSPRLHLLHADGTTAKSGALMPSTLKSENVSCAGLRLDWSSTSGTVKISNLMLNTGSTALPYEPYGDTWNTKSYAKIVDTTQQVTSFPVVVRLMENTIPSWTIKGNLAQDGTPSPSNIIYPSECGEMTGNLYGGTDISGTINNTYYKNDFVYANLSQGTYTLAFDLTTTYPSSQTYASSIGVGETGYSKDIQVQSGKTDGHFVFTFTIEAEDAGKNLYARFARFGTAVTITYTASNLMLNTGSTALPYEPYGYKLDISSANTTTPVYLGEVVSTRRIKKLVLTGEEGWVRTQNQKCYYVNASTGCPTDYLKQTITTSICSHYQSQNNTASGSNEVEAGHFCFFTGGGFELYIGETTISSAADFKTYLQQQYAAGTPVTVWYVLATETTTTLNEPLRKIGTYSDSVSGTNLSVTAQSPTTIDVDTSLKPSEMDLTYTGLKMCGRKKYAHGNSPQILPSAKAESRTSGNITLTCDGNGVYTLVGSPTPNTNLTFNIPPTEIPLSVGEGGNGTLSLFNDSVYNNFDITFVYQGTQYREAVTYSPNTINKTSTTYGSNSSDIGGKTIISIGVHITGYGNINCTFSPMITNDGQLPSTFQPYCSWQ